MKVSGHRRGVPRRPRAGHPAAQLENESITANGANVLAFEDGIEWDIKRVEGVSGMLGGGLYNMHLEGTGYVAIISDGPPVLIEIDGEYDLRRPTGRDHLVERRELVGEGRRQHEDSDRPWLGRDRAAQLLRQGLGADPAVGGASEHRRRPGVRAAARAARSASCSAAEPDPRPTIREREG